MPTQDIRILTLAEWRILIEVFVLFSIGTIKPLFKWVWPACWGPSHELCYSHGLVAAFNVMIAGIMIGQVFAGAMGDPDGRRRAFVVDVLVLGLALALVTGPWAGTLQTCVVFYARSFYE